MTPTEAKRIGASLLAGIPDEPHEAHRWVIDKVATLNEAIGTFQLAGRRTDPARRVAFEAQVWACEWSRSFLLEHAGRLLDQIAAADAADRAERLAAAGADPTWIASVDRTGGRQADHFRQQRESVERMGLDIEAGRASRWSRLARPAHMPPGEPISQPTQVGR